MSTASDESGRLFPDWERRRAALDRALDDALQQPQLVGAVLLVAQQGSVVYERVCGLADREQARPMTRDALFRYSSVTKPLVTAAALSLVAQGRLDLQSPVTRWLPDFTPKLPDGTQPVITLHHLLTHTAGLSYPWQEPADGPYHRAGVADGVAPSGVSLAENVRRIASVPLVFQPSTNWRYSVALDVAGAVIESAAEESLPAAVSRLVTAPLGLQDTAFTVVDSERLAAAYADGSPAPVRMGEPHDLPLGEGILRYSPARAWDAGAFASGGAGMIGSAPDLLRFLETIRTGGGPILPEAQAAQMLTSQIGAAGVELAGPGWGFSYGGALLTDPQAAQSPQSAGTLTWGGVYGHSWFVDPRAGLTAVLMTNTGIAGMNGPVTLAVRDAIYGADH